MPTVRDCAGVQCTTRYTSFSSSSSSSSSFIAAAGHFIRVWYFFDDGWIRDFWLEMKNLASRFTIRARTPSPCIIAMKEQRRIDGA